MTTLEDQARSLFLAAIGRAPGDWPTFLDGACGGRPEVRARVEELLRAHVSMGSVHARPADTVDLSTADAPGAAVGPYRLRERIGEGGFGVVFMAEQTEPVRRRVALKVLKPGMDTRQVVARFEAERQALALMDHPNIATVLDGGATAAGRPYFVMELVKGVPVTEFCDRHRLTPRDRLGLFLQVCGAVQHAHQKGVIHRDIKPSNVLVTVHDVTPVAKVIDFGVAKAVGQELTDKTVFTGFAQMIGTPLYMSPEQAGMSGLDADTRSDIYSLGVLLYELLTGTTPFDRDRFRNAGYDEIRRIIREEEPPKPSTRLSTLGPAAGTVSANRGTEPRKLSALCRGDLDWIVMKALEKDRNRRYETAAGLAADVRRYLADEPVLARPPSAGYRVRKFVRRNRRALVMTAAVAGAVLVGLGSLAGAVGWNLRDRAAVVARTDGEVERVLDQAEKLRGQSKWPEARAAVEQARALLAGRGGDDGQLRRAREFEADLEMAARLEDLTLRPARKTGGKDLVAKIDFAELDRQYARAFREFGIDLETLPEGEAAERVRVRPIRVELAAALDHWSNVRRSVGTAGPADWKHLLRVARAADPDEARDRLRDALGRRDLPALREFAGSDRVAALPPLTLLLLIDVLAPTGKAGEREALLREAHRRYPGDFRITLTLASFLDQEAQPRRVAEAIRFYSSALAIRPDDAAAYVNLGSALEDTGALDEAIALFRRATVLQPDLTIAHSNLGNALESKGLNDEALAAYDAALRLEPDNPSVHINRGGTLLRQEKFDAAVAALEHALRVDPGSATAYRNLGVVRHKQKRLDDAVRASYKAVELRPGDFTTRMSLAEMLHEQGAAKEAGDAYRGAFERRPRDAHTLARLGDTLKNRGLADEAVTAYREAVRLRPDLAGAHGALGGLLLDRNRLAEAVDALRVAVLLRPDDAVSHYNLGLALDGLRRDEEAVAAYREAVRARETYAEAHCNLGQVLRRTGRYAEALTALQRGHELGSARKGWPYPSIRWVQDAERLVELDGLLAAVLRGGDPPPRFADRFGVAEFSNSYKRLPVTAARLYEGAFAAFPDLKPDVRAVQEFNAARAAALASNGDAARLDPAERARWRKQAVGWLRSAFTVWAERAAAGTAADRTAVAQRLRAWRTTADLAAVRDPAALAELPEAERAACEAFWADVAALLAKVQPDGKGQPPGKP
jgi:serine/threonine protein kinase/Flp pilus assembly protein TadD